MSKIGHIGEFNPDDDDWEIYVERVKLYFTVNEIKNDLKVPVLLTLIGGKAYKKIRTLCSPDAPETKTLAQLEAIMKSEGGKPKRTQIAARFIFNGRKQQASESVSDYNLILKELATDCDFGAELKTRLRDQLVSGLAHKSTQEELLGKKDLTYKDALELALSKECALKEAASIASTAVNKLGKSQHRFNKTNSQKKRCKCCGRSNHSSENCFFKDAECHQCSQKGHIRPMCPLNKGETKSSKHPSSKRHERKSVKNVEAEEESDSSDDSDELYMNELEINSISSPPLVETVHINNTPVKMEIDTGAAVSVISYKNFKSLKLNVKLEKTSVVLTTYTKQPIVPAGVCYVDVSYQDKTYGPLELYVIKSDTSTLLGRSWLSEIRLDWRHIKSVKVNIPSSENIKQQYPELFSDTMGKLKGIKAKIELTDNARPSFLRARPVPLSVKELVETDINRLEREGILTRVNHSEWATPIVPVQKPDGSIRICGDFKVTINPVLLVDQYPQPRREELFASLAGGQLFSKIDLASAYLQMEVEDSSKPYLTINTHKGLFTFNRLPFGIASAPAIFQRTIETLLKGIPGVLVYQDDILITGQNSNDHLKSLHTVLSTLEERGLRVKSHKCIFFAKTITYLGLRIDANGVSTVDDKVQGVLEAPLPTNVSELRSFLGTVNYYASFIPDLSTKLAPLNKLLQNNIEWNWSEKCTKAFDVIKNCLCSAPVLAHYNPKLPLVIATDASPVGVAAVLSHRYPDNSERPIAYASRTLTVSEKNYSQIDREALGIIFGIKKFNEYVFGRHFTLVSDNRPLTHIFAPHKATPSIAAARIQRWAVFLGAHKYTIEHRPASKHTNVDGLSRLPVHVRTKDKTDTNIHFVCNINTLPITSDQIIKESQKDPTLSKVMLYVKNGWENADEIDTKLQPYYRRKNELNLINGVLTYGTRVVIPLKYRDQIMDVLHEGHLGTVKMKSVARCYVYWPNIDEQIEQKCSGCEGCCTVRKMPTSAPLHPWVYPAQPWRRLHIDYAGPFLNRMFLVVVDANTKWPEVAVMKHATTLTTINALRSMFARFGLPDQIVSDNGSQFTSNEFKMFLESNGIKQITSATYHPATNGLAERFVQTLKNSFKASKSTEATINKDLATFLLAYRNAQHSTTAASPATLLLGRQVRTRLDLLNPTSKVAIKVQENQDKSIEYKSSKLRTFETGDKVLVRDYRSGSERWKDAIVTAGGPMSYQVQVPSEGSIWKRHIDQMLPRVVDRYTPAMLPSETTDGNSGSVPDEASDKEQAPKTPIKEDNSVHKSKQETPPRRSSRSIIKPKRLIEE